MKKRTRALFLKVITFFQIFSLIFQPLSLLSLLILDPVVARAQGEAVIEEQILAKPVVEANVQAEPAGAEGVEEIINSENLNDELIDIEEELEEESEEESEETPPVINEEGPGEGDATDEADLELSIPEPTLTLMPTPMPTISMAEEIPVSGKTSPTTFSLMSGALMLPLSSGEYSISSTSGIWTSASPSWAVSGTGTSVIKWGESTYYDGRRSGLEFTAAGNQNFDPNETFLIGQLTHMNWPVTGTTATRATLGVTLNFSNPAISPNPTFSYIFDIEETTNSGTCPSWHIPGHPKCDDRITFPNAYGQEVFTIGDTKYTLVIDGFQSAYPEGSAVSQFITEESKNNTAFLVGHLSSVLVEDPAISLIKKTNNQDVAAAPGPELKVGDAVTWQYVIQNTGNVALTNISITDIPTADIDCDPYTDGSQNSGLSLASGASMTCTASGTVALGQFTNTATVVGTPPTGSNVSASDTSWYNGVLKQGTLIVKKVLNNDNGGTKNFTDFSFKVNNGSDISFEADGQNEMIVDVGTYNITENAVAGYASSHDNCSNVTVVGGGTATCTITNDDIQPKLTVTKIVSGGSKVVGDFDLYVSGTKVTSGEQTGFNAGTYTVSEETDADYNSVIGEDCALNGSITLAPGDVKECTITNTRKTGQISFIKNVTYGDASPSNWSFNVYKEGTLVGTYSHNSSVALDTGVYTVQEVGPTPSLPYYLDSIGGSACSVTVLSGVAQLAVTESGGTCIFGNSKKPQLTVTKVVNPTDSQDSFDFTITEGNDQVSTFELGHSGTKTIDVVPGSYTIAETGATGYSTKIECSGDTIPTFATTRAISLNAQENKSCTFTNTKLGSISGTKWNDVNGNGTKDDGEEVVEGVQICIDANANSVCDADEVSVTTDKFGNYTFSDLLPGTYTIIEKLDSGWEQTYPAGSHTVVLSAGELETDHNFGNWKLKPGINVVKNSTTEFVTSAGQVVPYTFTVTNIGNQILTGITVSDPNCDVAPTYQSGDTNEDSKLNLNETWTYTCSHTVTQDEIDAGGQLHNEVTVDSNESEPDEDEKDIQVTQSPALTIVKSATPSTYDSVGDVIDYSFVVTNTGNVTLIGPITVSDNKIANVICPDTASLAPGDDLICSATYTITLDDLDAESVTNVAFAEGYFGETPVVSPEDTETVTSAAGKITVYKYYDVNRDGVKDWDETTLADWEMIMSSDEEEDSIKQSTADSGSTLFYLPAGDWQLSETMQEDWEQTGIYCEYAGEGDLISLPGEGYGCHGDCYGWNECGDAATCALWACNIKGYANLVSYGKDYPCTQLNNCHLFNGGPGSIQWDWGNWCGVSGVTDIYCSNGDGVPQRLAGYNSSGDVYRNNAYNLTVNPGDKKVCYVGNTLNSQLMIEKSNDAWPNDQEIGDEVTYTIKLMATDGPVYDVSLFDLPPNAFSYVAGSYMADSSITGDLSLPEPNYASPGEWQLGDLAKDEIITVSYKAIIGDEADAGIYPDAAWATGTSAEAQYFDEEGDLLALSDPDFKANNGEVAFLGDQGHYGEEHFVGTRVAVVTDETPSAKYKVEKIKEKEGAVLGAVLPATGANFWLSLLAILSILTGTGLLLVPNRKRRQGKVLMMLLMLGLGLLMAKPVQAITSVRVAQPYNSSAELDQDTITNQDEFRIDFVVLNTEGLSLDAQCQQQEDGGAWTDIDTFYTVKAGGNSGYCEAKDLANSSQYAFRVLTSDGEEGQSVKVGLETDRPKKPVSYEKHEISSCKYEIKFKTADDGRTSKVEVYRSDDNVSFTAKASSRIKTISIGSDEKHSFETTRPDCDKDYYYAIRAFDQYGNASDLVGDREIKTVIVEGTEAEETTGALAVTETVVLDGDVGDDGVLSEGLLGEEVAEDEKGTILGIDTESLVSFLTKVLLPILVFVTISVLVYRLVIAKRNEK